MDLNDFPATNTNIQVRVLNLAYPAMSGTGFGHRTGTRFSVDDASVMTSWSWQILQSNATVNNYWFLQQLPWWGRTQRKR
jgi:hypothetical protein